MHVGASLSRVHEETRADFEATLVDMDGGDDHVHLLVEYPLEKGPTLHRLKAVDSTCD